MSSGAAAERFPAYLVRADDPILLSDAVRDLVHALVGDGDVSLMVEDIGGEDSDATIAATVDAAQTPPFLTDHRVVVLRDVGRLGALLELLEAVHGRGATLTADDVAPHLGDAGSVAPWDLTDAIDGGRIGDAIDLVRRMMHGGRHPLAIMATLHGHFARLLRLDGAGLRDKKAAAQALGLDAKQEWRAERLLGQARRLGHDNVSQAITLLARADVDLKGKREIPDDVVMEILVARLARLSPRR